VVLAAMDVPSDAALDIVTRLADRSLVAVDHARGVEARYRLLDSIRAFALERLGDAGLTDVAHCAHAAWLGRAAAEAARAFRGPD
jgi:predicted ATPase